MSAAAGAAPVRRVLLVVHPMRPAALALAERARAWWSAHGVEVVETPEAELLSETPLDIDLAISLGGDGTMLGTVRSCAVSGIAVLGVNLGRMGYLTEVEPDGIEEAFGRLLAGQFEVEERVLLEVSLQRVSGAPAPAPMLALNEASIERTAAGHALQVAVSIADRPFLTFVADGLLVATPTGSTAYNLSVRGPIVSPRLRALLLTPVAPHMLFDRTLVLEPDEVVRLELLDGRAAALVVDGASTFAVAPGDVITCRTSRYPARLATFGRRDFHAILRGRFGLTDR